MGGGSLSHISPVMREWRESRKENVNAALDIPSELKRSIETSVSQMWTVANKLASSAIETVRHEADAAIEAATAERDEALVEISRLEERIVELQKAAADKDQTIRKIQEERERERILGDKLASDNAALPDRVARKDADLEARLNDKDEQLKNLKTELKEARNNNKVLQAELVEIAHRVSNPRKSGK